MATAYSILRNYGEYIQPYDLNLLQQGLSYKQQKYDINAAKIQAEIDQYVNLDLENMVDKQYLRDRLGAIVDQVNTHGTMDLSSDGLTRNIQGHIKQVFDPIVMTAYASTKNYRKDQEEIEYIKEHHKELYSPLNEMYSQRNALKWKRSKTPGTPYQSQAYTPYVDVYKAKSKILADLAKQKGETVIEVPTGNGRIIKKTVKELTANEVRSIVENSLSPNELQQLKINAWGNFSLEGYKGAQVAFDKHVKERNVMLDGGISELKLAIESAQSPEIKDEYKKRLEELEGYKTRFNEDAEQVASKSGEELGFFLEKERLVNGLVSSYSFKDLSIEYKSDDAYWKELDYDLKVKDYLLKKYKIDHSGKEGEENKRTYAVVNGIGVGNETKDLLKEVETTKKQSVTVLNSKVNGIFNNLEQEKKEEVNKLVESAKLLKENEGLNNEEIKLKVLLDNKNKILTIEQKKNLLDSKQQAEQALHNSNNIYKKTSKSLETPIKTIGEILSQKPSDLEGVEVLVENGKGEYEKKNLLEYTDGINGEDAFYEEENKEKKETVERQVFGDLAMSLIQNKWIRNKEYRTELGTYVSRIAESFGEDIDIEKFIKSAPFIFKDPNNAPTVVAPIGLVSPVNNNQKALREAREIGRKKAIESFKGAPKTLAYLEAIKENKTYDWEFGTDSFEDVKRIHKPLSYSAIRHIFDNNVKEAAGKLKSHKNIVIHPDNQYYNNLYLLLEGSEVRKQNGDITSGEGGIEGKEKLPIVVKYDAETKGYRISQMWSKSASGGSGYNHTENSVIVSLEVMEDNGVLGIINLSQDKSLYNVETMVPIVNNDMILYEGSNISDEQDELHRVLMKTPLASNPKLIDDTVEFSTKDGLKNSIIKNPTFTTILFDIGENDKLVPNDKYQVITKVLENYDKIKMVATPNKTRTSILIKPYIEEGGVKIDLPQVDLKTKTFDEYREVFNLAPGYFLNASLQTLLYKEYDFAQNSIEGEESSLMKDLKYSLNKINNNQ